METRHVTPRIAFSGQPSESELEDLKGEGYAAIVNLRQAGEPEQPLSPADEGERAKALGLDYHHYAVGSAPLTTEGVDSVCAFLDRHADDKVLVHCRKGGRAAALLLLYEARKQGWAASEVLAKGEAMGLKVEGAGLRQLVQHYLDEHGTGGR